MLVALYIIEIFFVGYSSGLTPNDCNFNSMCTCSLNENEDTDKTIHSVSCLSVPFYKFPNLPEGSISQLEVVGTKTTILESESLAGCQVQALILTNNHLQHIADRSFSSLWKSLTSLDLSYNKLDSIPFNALNDIRNLQWINLHGNLIGPLMAESNAALIKAIRNEISSIRGPWSHMKNSISTLFLGENDLTVITNETSNPNSKSQQGLGHLKALIWLNLDGNRIYSIENDSMPKFLKTASMSYNLLSDFPIEVVASLPHLQWLYLRGNHIRLLPQYTFHQMFYLEKIDLAENYLSILPKNPFNYTLNIRDINLAFNDFRMLTSNCFSGLNTGRIILSYNAIENMDFDAFNGICTTLEYLDLDHNNLQHIPEGMKRLSALKYLYLSSNYLSYLSSSSFENFSDTLKAVSLSGNQLSAIPSMALANCTKISHFNIAFNEIFDIDRQHFRHWGSNIKSLILANNRITQLRSKVFDDLRHLRELSLSFNPLRHVDKDVFENLNNLESLEMSFAFDRNDMHHEIFGPLLNLKWLSLDHNNINTVYPSTFLLPELKYLNLESNKIHSIAKTFFKSTIHVKLQDVRLSNNELSVVETGMFRLLNVLETIQLANNKIKHLQRECFSDLPNLRTVILSHNSIVSVSSDAFTNLPNIATIDLHDNSLTALSFGFFTNISGPLHLNLSRNQIVSCQSHSRILNVHVLDLRYNNMAAVPVCIENTSGLKQFYLDYNIIGELAHNAFMHLTSLEYLGLQQNNIKSIKKKSFFGLQSLQVLDLSKNLIQQLHIGQFANMSKLRILNLSGNHLSYLAKEIFKGTHIEMLDLSYNSFSVVPSTSLSDIGISIRHFSMRANNVEHIDITTFPNIPLLQQFDLALNKLTILPDNVFTSLGLLHTLDLSSNPLRSNFKELFHYAQTLRHLNLANAGITSTPYFPLPNLVYLNLSFNNIESMTKNSVRQLTKLKFLDLSHNNLTQIPTQLWVCFPHLKSLDLSYNPIKEILADSFYQLPNLQELNIQYLEALAKFESESLTRIRILSKLSIQTWPNIGHLSEKLCHLFSHTDQLRVLKIRFIETELTDQLLCVTNSKIRQLEISGRRLMTINKDAFTRFTKNPELLIAIHGTKIEELPSGLFSNMNKIAHLTLNLKDNLLTHLHPEIFYANSSRWKSVGTTLISGGLFIANNPFRCGCHLSWLSDWLKRWTRESLQSHNSPVEAALRINEVIRDSTCVDPGNGLKIPIVSLEPDDMSCHASALSNGSYSNNVSVIFFILTMYIEYVR